jgi:hypothetical protein
MTKVVIYSNTNLESFYEQTLQYLHEKYHTHPTMLNYGELTAKEAANISYHDAEGRAAASRSGVNWVQDNRQGGHWECSDGSGVGNKVF